MRASPRDAVVAARLATVSLSLALACGAAWAADTGAPVPQSTAGRAVAAAKRAAGVEAEHARTVDEASGAPKIITASPVRGTAAPKTGGTATTTAAKTTRPATSGAPTTARPGTRPGTKAALPGKVAGVPATATSSTPTLRTLPVGPSPTHLDDQPTYTYNALGRRDPFQPLIGGTEYVDIQAPPDLGALKVVGIVWGAEDKFALVEDARGNSLVMRKGDKVMNGFVEALKRDALVVHLTVDGQSQSVSIPLTRKGDSNANR